MTMQTKQEILEALTLPPEEYRAALQPEARRVRDEAKGRRIAVSAMLGYDNICRNRCLYCGMRAGSRLERYRYTPDQVLDLCRQAREMGLDRLFLISGEDPKFPFEGLLRMVEGARGMGFSHISLACGEFDRGQYGELKAAGADEYPSPAPTICRRCPFPKRWSGSCGRSWRGMPPPPTRPSPPLPGAPGGSSFGTGTSAPACSWPTKFSWRRGPEC